MTIKIAGNTAKTEIKNTAWLSHCLNQYRGAIERANYWINRINSGHHLPTDFWDADGHFRGWELVERHKEEAAHWLVRAEEAF
jgi:hypothetical protein